MERKQRVLNEDVHQKATASKWNSIDWPKCEATVRRLQARIVKAEKQGRHNKVKSLQWLLTRSFAARALAVRRVTRNKGRNTPGVDNQLWKSPKSKFQAVLSLKLRGYKPSPLRRIHIPKPNGRKRPLGIPTMKDRAMQALFLISLEPIAEIRADLHSYGFRPRRSTHDAVEQAFILLSRQVAPKYVLEADIKGCFDNMSHQWLLRNIPVKPSVLKGWLKSGFMENNRLYPTHAGSPQGGIVSPTIANMTLDGLEAVIDGIRRTHPGQWINMVRYADDFIVTGTRKDTLEKVVKPAIEAFLAERGLALSPEKTKVSHIQNGFDFLGQNFRKYNEKLIVTPSKNNLKNFLRETRTTIARNKTITQSVLIKMLNPIIMGWARYHSAICAKETYCKADNEIWKALWKWARRRHPAKSLRWVKNRYFPRVRGLKWNFSCKMKDGKSIMLSKASSTRIQRHVKIKAAANPFDPKWEEYFAQRTLWKLFRTSRGRRKVSSILRRQNEICPQCPDPIDDWKNLALFRKTPMSKGGNDNVSNLILQHRVCSVRSLQTGPQS